MNQRPLILISNDDGYEAKGLQALVDVAKEFGEVVVVVPEAPRSDSNSTAPTRTGPATTAATGCPPTA